MKLTQTMCDSRKRATMAFCIRVLVLTMITLQAGRLIWQSVHHIDTQFVVCSCRWMAVDGSPSEGIIAATPFLLLSANCVSQGSLNLDLKLNSILRLSQTLKQDEAYMMPRKCCERGRQATMHAAALLSKCVRCVTCGCCPGGTLESRLIPPL